MMQLNNKIYGAMTFTDSSFLIINISSDGSSPRLLLFLAGTFPK